MIFLLENLFKSLFGLINHQQIAACTSTSVQVYDKYCGSLYRCDPNVNMGDEYCKYRDVFTGQHCYTKICGCCPGN